MKAIVKKEFEKMPADVKAALRNGDMTTYDVLKECADSINEQVDYLNETTETLADNEAERIAAEQARNTAEQARNTAVAAAIEEVEEAIGSSVESIAAYKTASQVDIVLGRRDDVISETIPSATPTAAGVMSAADKEKLDSLTPSSSAAYKELIPTQDITDKVHFIGHLESDATKTLRADDISGWTYKSYQSSPIWLNRRSILFFDASQSYRILGMDAVWNDATNEIIRNVTLGSCHCNDAFVDGNVAYIDDGTNGNKDIYKLNLLTNTATKVTLDIEDWQGEDATNNTCTQLSGVCDYNETQYLAVAYDAKQSDESETIENPPTITDQYLRVYVVNKSDGTIADTLFGNPDVDGAGVDVLLDTEGNEQLWEGIFLQGATYVDGYLYVATNRYRASASADGGIAVWVIDLARKTLVDKIIFDGDAFDPDGNALAANNATYGIGVRYAPGDFEPEGIDYVRENGVTYLYMGLGHYAGITKLLKFQAPVVGLSK